jgi:hypothetical protein
MKTNTNKLVAGLVGVGMALGAGSVSAAETGNGSPSGTHYNLNITGHTKCAGDDLKGGNAHRIQVLLNGGNSKDEIDGILAVDIDKRNKIYLQQDDPSDGDDFRVLDGNACDGDGALFQLPAPDPDGDGVTTYTIYARALGKPNGYALVDTCATAAGDDGILHTADDEIVCDTAESLELRRSRGKSTFINVTKKLTSLTATFSVLDADGNVVLVTDTVNIFDPRLYDYFWNWDNHGLRLAQLRFFLAD